MKCLLPVQSLMCPVPLLRDNPCFTALLSLSFLIIDKQMGIYKGREFPSFTKDCVLFILFFSHKKTCLLFNSYLISCWMDVPWLIEPVPWSFRWFLTLWIPVQWLALDLWRFRHAQAYLRVNAQHGIAGSVLANIASCCISLILSEAEYLFVRLRRAFELSLFWWMLCSYALPIFCWVVGLFLINSLGSLSVIREQIFSPICPLSFGVSFCLFALVVQKFFVKYSWTHPPLLLQPLNFE